MIKSTDLVRRIARRGFAQTASLFGQIAYSLERHPLLAEADRAVLQRNRRFSMRYQGKRAFVIGTGPSLNSQNLGWLANDLVFAANGFWRHPILVNWQPVSLALADPDYFNGSGVWNSEFAGLRRVASTSVFFVPLNARSVIQSQGWLPEDRTFYCAMYGNMARVKNFSYDLTQPIPGCQTVSLFSIMIALYMGCNPIYLVGMDHDFLATPSKPTHFYEGNDLPENSPEVDTFSTWSYDKLMAAVLDMWGGYRNLKRMAASQGQYIYNATAGGFLDVFPRVNFESLFSEDSKV